MIESQNVLPQIPEGWAMADLGEILFRSNKKFNPLSSPEEKFVGLKHIEKGTGKLLEFGKSTETKSLKTKFREGDILYGKLRPYLNKVHVARFNGVCSTDILVFSKNDFVDNRYIASFLQTHDFVQYVTQRMSGVQHPRVNYKTISKYPIALPPLAEQHRIVTKFEELFSRLNAGAESLKKLKAQLQRYRQAVLKHAFTGKLTEKWRKTHKHRTECKQSELGNMPEDWKVVNVKEITVEHKQGFYTPQPYTSTGIKLVRITDLLNPKLSYETMPYLELDNKTFERFRVFIGDFLVARSGAIGRYGIVTEDAPCVFGSYIIRFRFDSSCIDNRFFGYLYESNRVAKQLLRFKHGGANINVNAENIKSIKIPLPPLSEQYEIVEKINSILSIVDMAEKVGQQSLVQSERLRQSILMKAFEGRLVPQDSTDEPAEKLLERIKEEKEQKLKGMRKKKTKREGKRKQVELIRYAK